MTGYHYFSFTVNVFFGHGKCKITLKAKERTNGDNALTYRRVNAL